MTLSTGSLVRPRKEAPSGTGLVLTGCLIYQEAVARATMPAARYSNMTPNPRLEATAAGFWCNRTATTRVSCSPTGLAERNIRPNVPRNIVAIHKARPFRLANASPHRACRARAWQSMATGTAREHGSRCRQKRRNATPRVNIPFAAIMSSSRNQMEKIRSNLPIRSRLIWKGSANSAKALDHQADKSL